MSMWRHCPSLLPGYRYRCSARSKSYELLSGKKDPFQFTKQFIEKTEARTGKSKVSWIMPPYDKTSIIDLITYTVNTVPENSIVFTSTVSTLLNADFISRIRDVTWLGKQAYSPIAFWEYFPSLIYDDQQPRPPTVEVSRYIGHFGELWYDHLAFFAKDYKRGSAAIRNSASEPIDILMSLESYDILRSVDPNLLVRYKPPVCKARAIVEWPRCNLQLLDNVGSGPILAKRLLQDGSIVGMDF